jgi:hypothetical protein
VPDDRDLCMEFRLAPVHFNRIINSGLAISADTTDNFIRSPLENFT